MFNSQVVAVVRRMDWVLDWRLFRDANKTPRITQDRDPVGFAHADLYRSVDDRVTG